MKIVHYGAYIDLQKVRSLSASRILKKKKKNIIFGMRHFKQINLSFSMPRVSQIHCCSLTTHSTRRFCQLRSLSHSDNVWPWVPTKQNRDIFDLLLFDQPPTLTPNRLLWNSQFSSLKTVVWTLCERHFERMLLDHFILCIDICHSDTMWLPV